MNLNDVSKGDEVVVKYKDVIYKDGGRTEETVTRKDTGHVLSIPSQKFEDFDFDYELNKGDAVRSVSLELDLVSQLIYEAGGDRESESWDIVSVSFS